MTFKLHYFRDPKGNFGDDINGWLWESLAPGQWNETSEVLFTGIGTLIDDTIPKAKSYLVFSSGVGYGPRPANFGTAKWTIGCVRGPLSADILNLKADDWITDGAILLSVLSKYKSPPAQPTGGVLFMPHHKVIEGSQLQRACHFAGVEYVSPHDDSVQTIEKIRNARLVLADAMHAAIVADTLRVPWLPLQTSPEINTFKWLDWTLSMQLPYEPRTLPPSSVLDYWRSATLPLYGQTFALSDPSEQNARDHFYAHERRRRGRYWKLQRNLGRAVYTRAFRPILLSRPGQRVTAAQNERAIMAVAQKLSDYSKEGGYLSQDAVFTNRRDRMLGRLQAILSGG